MDTVGLKHVHVPRDAGELVGERASGRLQRPVFKHHFNEGSGGEAADLKPASQRRRLRIGAQDVCQPVVFPSLIGDSGGRYYYIVDILTEDDVLQLT